MSLWFFLHESAYEYITCRCIGIPKHWRLSLFRYETFMTFLTFRFLSLVFRHEERESQFLLCWPFYLTQQTRGESRRPNWTRLVQLQISTHFVQHQISTNCFFQKSPKPSAPRFRAWRHSHPCLISHLGFLLWHLWLSHPPRASVNTCSQCVHLHVH